MLGKLTAKTASYTTSKIGEVVQGTVRKGSHLVRRTADTPVLRMTPGLEYQTRRTKFHINRLNQEIMDIEKEMTLPATMETDRLELQKLIRKKLAKMKEYTDELRNYKISLFRQQQMSNLP